MRVSRGVCRRLFPSDNTADELRYFIRIACEPLSTSLRLTGGGQHPFPPGGGRWGWGAGSTRPTPTRTLPGQGGGEVFAGDGHDRPPPVGSPVGRVRVGVMRADSWPVMS